MGHLRVPIRPLRESPIKPRGPVYGMFLGATTTAYIHDGLAPALEADTTLHELLHAAWSVAGLPDKATEEQAINSLTPIILCILRDNPDLVRWLVQQVTE